MKIVLLASAYSIHTQRWANGLSKRGVKVYVVSQHKPLPGYLDSVILYTFPYRGLLGYFTMIPKVKKLLLNLNPDLINAHYASGYGTTARFSKVAPLLLSVWGSDVYQFPAKSFIHKWLVRKNLDFADAVASTSQAMAIQTRTIAPSLGQIHITPFGVSIDKLDVTKRRLQNSPIIIGTVKSLEYVYGIDILLKSFALLREKLLRIDSAYENRLQLRIIGGGGLQKDLESLALKIGIREKVTFVGRVDHSCVNGELDKLDVFAALSREESFGVAVIEASMMAKPVVVSNVGGLPEVVMDKVTGLVVPSNSPEHAADALMQLVLDQELRIRLGMAGKKFVSNKYSWDACLQNMIEVYKSVLSRSCND
ncbi:glycosyltransferase family 4 protein [Pseudoalteromonas piscicida]|uniref:Glycosyltransferase family 4 protein n=1 Tax=Pseudoalteromonas piscicida TaxID=43662 RepID=A0AAQ2EVU7_PSEO7|nr:MULTISPECIES: glycosyltransferase [Pseudoalteromonas]KJY90472.1 hypothetical protein TW75_07505 [Pseudoalteromonas piscicida]TMN43930.1 glycosyltransferase family 4 protein [Pseudoalteromonas piscicida]TMN44169.1 glycosyltransferase family 4 protein [Pseudoalteromonas piscicida]TMN49695.1 glycosyltransferase family 4 protein [Pseudoalteromonas piscicida]TMN57541.1 glycosyltransferase family 4 protein [Pseudoalteromonas piscicida]